MPKIYAEHNITYCFLHLVGKSSTDECIIGELKRLFSITVKAYLDSIISLDELAEISSEIWGSLVGRNLIKNDDDKFEDIVHRAIDLDYLQRQVQTENSYDFTGELSKIIAFIKKPT